MGIYASSDHKRKYLCTSAENKHNLIKNCS
jgi:hypothetical protein